MNIFISGSSSILGTAMMESFFKSGHTIISCPHFPEENAGIENLLQKKAEDQSIDLVILLTSEELFNTTCTKSKIVKRCANQIEINKKVCAFFVNRSNPPQTIIAVSSVYFYDSTNSDLATETSEKGSGFLADYYTDLEAVTAPASAKGIRIIHLRLGRIIARKTEPSYPKLPYLPQHLPVVFEDKSRLVSWVSQEDAVRAMHFILEDETISGPVNIVCGDPLSKKEFNNSIAKVYGLKKSLPLPSSFIKMTLGDETASVFNTNTRAIPFKLMSAGFLFKNISLPEYFQN